MSEEDGNSPVHCLQCDWPLLRSDEFMLVYGHCEHCGEHHFHGTVHTFICALAFAEGRDRPSTQRLRVAALRTN